MITQILITTLLINLCSPNTLRNKDEESARKFMEDLNKQSAKMRYKATLAAWIYKTNITNENMEAKVKQDREKSAFQKRKWRETISYPWQTFQDPDLRRQFRKYSALGSAALQIEKSNRLAKVVAEMQSNYAKAKICSFSDKSKCDLALDPELDNILIWSENCEELKHVWVAWRDASGKKVKKLYEEFVNIKNEVAVLNNYEDNSEAWLSSYEDDDVSFRFGMESNFKESIHDIWKQMKPLYQSMHAYVRRKLREKYGKCMPSNSSYIPAHLLGNMWAQSWISIYKYVIPYPGTPTANITSEMHSQGYTPEKIFKTAEEFFTSINMKPMPKTFWKYSVLKKPQGREVLCHPSAWDFGNGKDFRIKQCTKIQEKDFYTAHHEMGHIQYYLQYKKLPFVYRSGANSGFHEAVGDVIALSVSTEKHLHKVGLLKEYKESRESTINRLMQLALKKIAFLPYAYILDKWRWKVFSGKIKPENYNAEWWKLRRDVQGIDTPILRSEDDFDPGAKYHVISGKQYIPYFISHIIQFQFHKALCEKAGQYKPNNPEKPLHKCDIYQSAEAGNDFAKMLQMGASKPWPDAMQVLTGQRKMNTSAILEYFAPLKEWIDKENKKNGETIGWANQ